MSEMRTMEADSIRLDVVLAVALFTLGCRWAYDQRHLVQI